jgi:hypothetical protein
MEPRRRALKNLCLVILCCLVPLAATVAVVSLRVRVLPVAVMGMLLLVPIGHALLAEPPRHDTAPDQSSPRIKPRQEP